MTWTIYGFRVAGEVECRYVGLTSLTPPERLAVRIREVECALKRNRTLDPEGFIRWLISNPVEAVGLARAETKADAHETERAVAELLLRLNHRLFNTWLVPADRRICWRARTPRPRQRTPKAPAA